MSDWSSDIRFAFRTLLKNPGFAAVAVLTLALGIGANSAIFSVVNGVLLRPLDYRSPDELVAIASQFPTMGFDEFWISPPEFMELKERNRAFASVGGYRTGTSSVGGGDRPVRVTSAVATWELFPTLGVSAQLGRTFAEEEDVPNAEPVAVLSHELWRGAFAGDPSLVGRTIEVNGTATRVVGVMPEGFDVGDENVQIYTPVGFDRVDREQRRGNHFLNVVGRLQPGATLATARADLDRLLDEWERLNPGQHRPNREMHPMIVASLQDDLIGNVRSALFMLLGAVGFVLLIACANVGNLLLAKAETRGKEIAVRTALGAGGGRLLRQFMTESTVLALLGGALGLFLGWSGVRLLLATSPDSIPRAEAIGVDPPVLLFTLGVSLLTGVIFGLAPALHLRAQQVNQALREGGHRTTAGSGRQQLRRLLVVSEVALAVILVVGSGLMIRSFAALQRVDPGFEPDRILTFGLYLPPATYENPGQVDFYRRLLGQLEAAPGIESAAAMSGLPPRRNVNANDTQFEGVEQTPDGPAHNVDFYQVVTTDYLETMRIPLVAGRNFTIADDAGSGPVVLINETLARVFYPDQDPLGRRLRPSPFNDDQPWLTIVGIVKDVKQAGLEEPTGTELYFHYPQIGAATGFLPRAMNVVVRTSRDPIAAGTVARRMVNDLDASLPIDQMRSMDDVMRASVSRPRFLTTLLFIFAAVALAALGTYGVMAYSVAERRQEIGIRMALGAQGGSVLGMVLAQGALVAGAGVVIGVLGSLGLTRLLTSLLFGVSATDTVTFLLAPVVLAAVALTACFVPAWRATRVDPVQVLRQE